MEVYPFHHQNLFFNIITDYDLTFKEIRGVLGYLLQMDAFKEDGEDRECGKLYGIQLENVRYEVDVNGYHVMIYRRIESA